MEPLKVTNLEVAKVDFKFWEVLSKSEHADEMKQKEQHVHRKKNASNCTFLPLLVVIINSKYANN